MRISDWSSDVFSSDLFAPGRSLRRILRSNADLTVRFTPPRATAEQFALFRGYIHSRPGDGEMAGMTEQEYRDMVESSDIDTRLAELRDRAGRLGAVCLLRSAERRVGNECGGTVSAGG